MPTWTIIAAGGVLLALLVAVAYRGRSTISAWLRGLPDLRKGHVLGLFLLALLGPSLAMGVGFIARERFNEEVERNQITRSDVREIARRVSTPTARELAAGLRRFYEACSPAEDTPEARECRRQIVRTINRVIRVENARIVPVRDSGSLRPRERTVVVRPPARPPIVRPPVPPVVPEPASDQRVPGLQRRVSELSQQVADLSERRQLDSKAVDEVEDLVRAVETTVGALTGRLDALGTRVDGLLADLCRGALRRLLGALGSCR